MYIIFRIPCFTLRKKRLGNEHFLNWIHFTYNYKWKIKHFLTQNRLNSTWVPLSLSTVGNVASLLNPVLWPDFGTDELIQKIVYERFIHSLKLIACQRLSHFFSNEQRAHHFESVDSFSDRIVREWFIFHSSILFYITCSPTVAEYIFFDGPFENDFVYFQISWIILWTNRFIS